MRASERASEKETERPNVCVISGFCSIGSNAHPSATHGAGWFTHFHESTTHGRLQRPNAHRSSARVRSCACVRIQTAVIVIVVVIGKYCAADVILFKLIDYAAQWLLNCCVCTGDAIQWDNCLLQKECFFFAPVLGCFEELCTQKINKKTHHHIVVRSCLAPLLRFSQAAVSGCASSHVCAAPSRARGATEETQ